MNLLQAPPRQEDPRLRLQQLLRAIRAELVRERTVLDEREQRLLIAVVVAEVELGRQQPALNRVDHALEMAVAWDTLSDYAERGRSLLDEVLRD